MNIRLSLAGALLLVSSSAWSAVGWSNTEALCAHLGEWEEIDVVGLEAVQHREIVASDRSSTYLPTRRAIDPVRQEDYVLRVVVDTERRHGAFSGSEHEAEPVDADGSTCQGIVRQFTEENLVDLDVISSSDMGSEHPAGKSLKDLFTVSVDLTLKNGSVPESVFDPRNVQTLSQYLARGPKQPLVINLRLDDVVDIHATHVFYVVMFTADGNAHSARSEPVTFVQKNR